MPLIDVLNRLKITPDMSPDEIAEIFNDANITPDSLSLEPDVSDVTKPTIPVTPERLAVDRPQEPIDLPAGDKPEDVNIKEAAGKPDGRVYPLTDWHRPTVRRSVSNRFGALRRPSEPVDIPAREKLENININLRDTTGQPEDLPIERPSEPMDLPSGEDPEEARKIKDTTGQPEDLPVERPRIELEQEDELHLPEEGKPVTEHYVDLDVITKDMIKDTQNTIGPFSEQENTITILKDSLRKESIPGERYKIVIDPNANDAWIIDNRTGDEVYRTPVGTGDITGNRYGEKYFTPTGKGTIVNEVPYPAGTREKPNYGDYWMGTSWKSIGLHGPWNPESIDPETGRFVNEGRVSHGCIRLTADGINTVAEYLNVGSEVEILPYESKPSLSLAR